MRGDPKKRRAMKRAPAKRAVGEDVDSCEKRQEREVARWAHYLGNSGASSDPSQDMTNAPRTKEAITTVVNRQDLTVYELCSVGINNEEAHIIVTSRWHKID